MPPTFSRPGVRGDVAHAGRQRLEDRIEVLDHACLAADHHAVAALQAPDATARPHVHVVDPLRREFLGAPDVVHVVGIAAVDEDVACLEMGRRSAIVLSTTAAGTINQTARGFVELLHEVRERGGPHRFLLDQLFTAFGDMSKTTH